LSGFHHDFAYISAQRCGYRFSITLFRDTFVTTYRLRTGGLQTGNVPARAHGDGVALPFHSHGINFLTLWCGGRFRWLSAWRWLKGTGIAAILEKAQPNLRKQRIGEHVIYPTLTFGQADILILGSGFQISVELFQLRLQQVGGSASNGFGTSQDPGLQIFVYSSGGSPVLALEHTFCFPGNGFIALAREYVHYRLGTHNLGCRSNQ